MKTILTDDERRAAIKSVRHGMFTEPVPDEVARAVEAAVLAKLAQQADRQRVPEGYVLVPVEPTDEMVDAACDKSDFFRVDFVLAWDAAINASPELTQSATSHTHKVVPVTPTKEMLISGARAPVELLSPDGALQVYRAMLAAAPEAPEQAEQAAEPVRDEREPSPTAGMSLAQRILHVGGRNNAAGYVEFGSTQAVEALVRHVLRDLPDAPPAQASAVDERAAFEAWVTERGVAMHYEGDGHYGNATVARWWEAWKARAALAQKGGAA